VTPPEVREPALDALQDDELEALLRSLPKSDIHCHLDGSMRPETVAELARDAEVEALAREYGFTLPPPRASGKEMKELLCPGRECQSLVDYLKAFAYTVAVLQTPAALERAAYELAADCAAENVRYLEVRFAPMLHINRLMDGIDVLRAVDRGLDRAEREHAGKLKTAIIVCALRNFDRSLSAYYRGFAAAHRYANDRELAPLVSTESARLTVAAYEAGLKRVLAFDLAGPEENYPPKHHRDAFHTIISNLLNITVHAGEAYGPRSIVQAVAHLGAHRIGHGTRVLEEGSRLAEFLVDRRIPVEVCLTSNVQTRAVPSLAAHPFKRLLDAEVRTCICTDNRLVSDTTCTRELFLAVRTFKLSAEEVRRVLLYGFKSAFLPYHDRRKILIDAKAELRERGLGWGQYH